MLDEYLEVLNQVSQGLPKRLQAKLGEVREGLPLLFRPGYLVVLQHDDLLENNIHVDEATGCITGIDWAHTIVGPFGVSIAGLETVLGVQTMKEWHLHPNHIDLRKHFWETFYREIGHVSGEDRHAIEVARLFGLFRTHGFEQKDRAIACLETLCLI